MDGNQDSGLVDPIAYDLRRAAQERAKAAQTDDAEERALRLEAAAIFEERAAAIFEARALAAAIAAIAIPHAPAAELRLATRH